MATLHLRRRLRAARVNVHSGRIETPEERADREANEAAALEGAAFVKARVDAAPLGCWFPGDELGSGRRWIPSFFTLGRHD